jgi:multiple sugar transport system substrate-binding protein
VEEAEKMRNVILKPFGAPVEFIPEDEGPFHDRIRAEIQAGKVSVDVVGALHGNFVTLLRDNALEDLTPLMERLKDRPMIPQFVELGKLGTDRQYCIPWMQATYILAINKKALDYLPAGADVNALTWDQLRQWGRTSTRRQGSAVWGSPWVPRA